MRTLEDKSSDPVDAVSTACTRGTSVVNASLQTDVVSAEENIIQAYVKPCFQTSHLPLGRNQVRAQATNVITSQLNPEAPPYVGIGTPTATNICSDNQKTVLL